MNTDKLGSVSIIKGLRIFAPHERFWNILQSLSLSVCVHLCLISLCLFTFSAVAAAQVRPVYDRGVLGLGQLLKRLNTSASVLMIGAHPDDEDTALLAYLARGENARTAYLSLTRGDGGQNIIGPELGEALGVIRTEELLQARKLDGAEQYFTRAYDYGFSKTLGEAKAKWDEKVILCDVVRVIRDFRPLVVVSQFSGTPADGHGHHQFSGYISPIAVKAAADTSQCSETGAAWQVKKFYVRHGFRATGEPRLRVNTGKYDPLLGRSYFEIAMEARSQHKSQEQGVLELKGDQFSGLNLSGSDVIEKGIFDGLDISIKGIAASTDNSENRFEEMLLQLQLTAAKAFAEYDALVPEKSLATLTEGYKLARDAELATRIPGSIALVRQKQAEFLEAIRLAAGIRIDALSDRENIAPGEFFFASVKAFVAAKNSVSIKSARMAAPDRWAVAAAEPPKENTQGFFRRETGDFAAYFSIGVGPGAEPTQPYWLAEPRDSDLFRLRKDDDSAALSFHPTLPFAEVTLDVLGTELTFNQPVEYRFADDTRGEIRRNLNVVPNVTIELGQPLLIVPFSERPQTRTLKMSVTNHSTKPVTGTVSLNIDGGNEWKNSSPQPTFDLKRRGEKNTVSIDVTIPAKVKPGSYQMAGQAVIGDSLASSTIETIAYPHIQTHRLYRRAIANIKVFDIKTSAVKIGYIAGSGDRVPEAIRQMGMGVEILSESDIASGDLSKFDTIVVGIRAYQVRPDVVASNKRLLDFANNGGTLIVQYQLPGYSQQNLMPYPAQMGPRVADENARVTILQPEHPIFNFPNKITDADFDGWVQERNLYNFSTMDEKYTGLLESHDAGEVENKGGLVVADVGKGNYIYCSYSLFRQLPAGVPGAYRFFANMLSFSKPKK